MTSEVFRTVLELHLESGLGSDAGRAPEISLCFSVKCTVLLTVRSLSPLTIRMLFGVSVCSVSHIGEVPPPCDTAFVFGGLLSNTL